MFSSVVELAPTPDLYDKDRVETQVLTPGVESLRVILEYSTKHIASDTTRSELHQGGQQAVVAHFDRLADDTLYFRPLVIGAPWLTAQGQPDPLNGAEWFSYDFYEIFIEDFDEFAKVRDVTTPTDFDVMKEISEEAFKSCLAEILGDSAKKDWGGETSDHYSAHIHLQGSRSTAAFVLKGPGNKFTPMTLNHLGKNNDQIYRLSQEPAQVLVVQHCHEISSPVRATLRAFAVRPGLARRYCLIDGRDSLRLLQAYDKLDQAVELSKS